MYLLNDTPVFLEFLKRFLKFVKLDFPNKKFQNKLFIHSKCNCGQKDCSTVYLKSNNPFKIEVQGNYIFDTNKEIFIIHIFEDGFFEFEALCYDKFPFKKEINKFLKNQKIVNVNLPKRRKEIKKLTKNDECIIHKYFRDLRLTKLKIFDLGKIEFEEELEKSNK